MPAVGGFVFDSSGAPVDREIRVYRRDTGALLGKTRSSGGDGDPHFDKVSLLLHMDGVNGSTVFKDETGKNVSAFGAPTPVLSTAQAKFGQSSLLVTPTGTVILSGIEADSSADFDFGGDDFTVEWWQFWANPSSPRYQAAFQRGYNVAGAMTLVTGDADGRYALFLGAGNQQVLKESTAGAINTWVHYALVRSGGVFTLWRGGEASASGGSALTVGVPNKFAIGCYASDSGNIGQVFNGYIDEFRVTKGVARYTANFTPPAAQLPDFYSPGRTLAFGEYYFAAPHTGEVNVVCLDDASSPLENDLILRTFPV